MTTIGLDTNFLVYAQGFDGVERKRRAADVILALSHHDLVLPVQVVGEFVQVCRRKGQLAMPAIDAHLAFWKPLARYVGLSVAGFEAALELVRRHGLQTYDAVILASVAECGGTMLLSEDMHHGFAWRGCTVVNPFVPDVHPLLASLMPGG